MTRICPCHRLPLVEELRSDLGPCAALDTPLCAVTLIPQPAWYICDCDEVVGCADASCGGVLWGEGGASDAVVDAREILTAVLAHRQAGHRPGRHGTLAGAHRVLALAALGAR